MYNSLANSNSRDCNLGFQVGFLLSCYHIRFYFFIWFFNNHRITVEFKGLNQTRFELFLNISIDLIISFIENVNLIRTMLL